MKVLILQGSPRKNGNTKQLTEPFADELRKHGVEIREEWLYDKDLKPCMGCGTCQDRMGEVGCRQKDDFEPLVNALPHRSTPGCPRRRWSPSGIG